MRTAALAAMLPAALLVACSDSSAGNGDASTTAAQSGAAVDSMASGNSGSSGASSSSGASGSSGATAEPVAAKPSAGCDKPAPAALTNERQALTVDGVERWWLMEVPAAASKRKPLGLVVDFHGLLEGASVHAAMSGFAAVGASKGFFVATPNGTGNPIHWAVGTGADGQAERAFVTAMLDDLAARYCVDTNRVYATGLSNGAMMSSVLACDMSDRFAAVAPIAGVMAIPGCKATRPVPVMAVHGTADAILHFDGTVGSIPGMPGAAPTTTAAAPTTTAKVDLNGPGYPANVAAWAKRNGCDEKATDSDVTANVILRTYSCPPGAAVEFYIVKGGGHSWPGSQFSKSIEKIVGPTTFDINASELAWEFFSAHPMGA